MIKHLPVFIFALFSVASLAEEASHHDHGDEEHETVAHEAHLHGFAELMLAIEGDVIEISLASPAINIVGFEHKASSEQQISAVQKAKLTLESSEQLFTFAGANCSIKQAEANLSALNSDQHHHDDHEQTDNDKHSEITAKYLYNCQPTAELESISVDLLDHFPGIEQLNAMWITDTQQSAAKLTANNKIIRIR